MPTPPRPPIFSRLEASGYDIDYGRSNNRHYVIIRKP